MHLVATLSTRTDDLCEAFSLCRTNRVGFVLYENLNVHISKSRHISPDTSLEVIVVGLTLNIS